MKPNLNLRQMAKSEFFFFFCSALRKRDKPNGAVLSEWPHNDRAVVLEGPVVVAELYWYRLQPMNASRNESVWSAFGIDRVEGPWFVTCPDQPRFVPSLSSMMLSITNASNVFGSTGAGGGSAMNDSSDLLISSAATDNLMGDDSNQAMLIGIAVGGVVLAVVVCVMVLLIVCKLRSARDDEERAAVDVLNEQYDPEPNPQFARATAVTVDPINGGGDGGGTTFLAAETIDDEEEPPLPDSGRYNDLKLVPSNRYVTAPKSNKNPRYSVGAMSTFVEPKQ
jgi:hypothetical protein